MGRKKRKVWLWLVVERAWRRIVGWTLSSRGKAPLRQFWQSLPERYRRHCWHFTDPTSEKPIPRCCPKGEGQANIVEALNCSLRQRCGVLVRKSCSFSKSLAMHNARIKIVIWAGLGV